MHAPHSMTAIFCTLGGLCIQNYSLSDASVVYLMLQLYCCKGEARQISTWCAKKERGDREEGKVLDAAGAKGRPERGWAPARAELMHLRRFYSP